MRSMREKNSIGRTLFKVVTFVNLTHSGQIWFNEGKLSTHFHVSNKFIQGEVDSLSLRISKLIEENEQILFVGGARRPDSEGDDHASSSSARLATGGAPTGDNGSTTKGGAGNRSRRNPRKSGVNTHLSSSAASSRRQSRGPWRYEERIIQLGYQPSKFNSKFSRRNSLPTNNPTVCFHLLAIASNCLQLFTNFCSKLVSKVVAYGYQIFVWVDCFRYIMSELWKRLYKNVCRRYSVRDHVCLAICLNGDLSKWRIF